MRKEALGHREHKVETEREAGTEGDKRPENADHSVGCTDRLAGLSKRI